MVIPQSLTITEAYQLQHEIARLRQERGERIIGYKVGCISRAIQEQLGVGEPVFGRLYATEVVRSPAQLSAQRYPHLAIEGELAVRLSQDLSSPLQTESEIPDAISSVFPVIELHRYSLFKECPPVLQLIVSSGMQAGLVLPEDEARYSSPTDRGDRLCVLLNGEAVDSVRLDDSLESAVTSLKWLNSKLAEFGLGLTKDQIVLTGSPMRLFPVGAKTRIVVTAASLGQSRAEVLD